MAIRDKIDTSKPWFQVCSDGKVIPVDITQINKNNPTKKH